MPLDTHDIDWERRGFNDYPDHHLYPTRDKYDCEIEKRYLTGWHKRAKEEEQDKVLKNFFGDMA